MERLSQVSCFVLNWNFDSQPLYDQLDPVEIALENAAMLIGVQNLYATNELVKIAESSAFRV